MTATWQEMNWQYLLAEIDRVRGAIEQTAAVGSQRSAVSSPPPSASSAPLAPSASPASFTPLTPHPSLFG